MIDCLRVFAAAVCFVCVFLFVLPVAIVFGILGGNLLRGGRPNGSGDDCQRRHGGGKYKLRGGLCLSGMMGNSDVHELVGCGHGGLGMAVWNGMAWPLQIGLGGIGFAGHIGMAWTWACWIRHVSGFGGGIGHGMDRWRIWGLSGMLSA